MKKKLLITTLASAFVLAGCSSSSQNNNNTQSSSQNTTSTEQSSTSKKEDLKPAYDFTLKDTSGKDVKLSDFKGKKVYINVWASWCGPCKIEMPGLERLYQKKKDDKDFVFLSVTSPSDKEFQNTKPADQDKETILGLAEQKKITYPILFDVNDRFLINYSVRSFPTHIFINSDGTLAEQAIGAMEESTLESKLSNLY